MWCVFRSDPTLERRGRKSCCWDSGKICLRSVGQRSVGPLISRCVRCGYASTPVFVGTTLEFLGTAGHHVCSLVSNGSENTGIKSSVHTWKQ